MSAPSGTLPEAAERDPDFAHFVRQVLDELEFGYIDRWTQRLGLSEIWRELLEQIEHAG